MGVLMQDKDFSYEKLLNLTKQELNTLKSYSLDFLEMEIKLQKIKIEKLEHKKYFWFQRKKQEINKQEIKKLKEEIIANQEKKKNLLKEYSK